MSPKGALGWFQLMPKTAAGLGVDPKTAAATLAQVLPQVIDHLTPDGQIPAAGQGGLGGLGGLADLFGKLKG